MSCCWAYLLLGDPGHGAVELDDLLLEVQDLRHGLVDRLRAVLGLLDSAHDRRHLADEVVVVLVDEREVGRRSLVSVEPFVLLEVVRARG